jgi:glycine betaine/proline transport system ATP-binding protein
MAGDGGVPRLEVRNLYKIYGPRGRAALRAALQAERAGRDPSLPPRHTFALRGVSFQVATGETFVVMGLSGSGKSTLVRCINRLIEPTAGEVLVDGEDVVRMDRARLLHLRRHRVAMVFQGFGLFPHRTVLDNAAYGLELRGVPRAERQARAQEMLETVGLGEWGRHYPDQLSGGMRQRVGLARALATDPEILLMDEPFSALDPLIRRRMQDELMDLQERLQKTIVFITHDLDEALRLGSRIAIMRAGRIVQVGTPDEILLHPADDYVRSFAEHVDRSKVLRAADIMLVPEPLLRLGHAPRFALREMERAGLSSAFVVGRDKRLAGLLSADAALAAAAEGAADLRGAVDEGVATVDAECVLRDLMPMAAASRYPLAVVDGERRLLGIVPRVAILRALAASPPDGVTADAGGEPAPEGATAGAV